MIRGDRFQPGTLIKAAALALATTAGTAHAAIDEELVFRVLLNDREIGIHRFRVAGDAGRRTVETNADFNVTFLAIPVYNYNHDSREIWNDGCLAEINSRTDDNGKAFAVAGRASGGLFEVSANDTQRNLEATCVMNFAYWNRNFLQQTRLLNAQTGEYLPVTIGYEGIEQLSFDGAEVAAERYYLRNPGEGLDMTVWYHETSGAWLSLESRVGRGKVIRYVPAPSLSAQRPADARLAALDGYRHGSQK